MSLYEVELQALENVTATTKRIHIDLQNLNTALKKTFTSIETVWQSRSCGTFTTLCGVFNGLAQQLDDLLGDSTRRLDTAHANYVAAEEVNKKSLTPQ